MTGVGIDWLGWIATGVFFASYFCRQPQTLRLVQIAGSILWGVYGLLIGATPVVVSNVLVCGAAAWTLLRQERVARRALLVDFPPSRSTSQ